MPYHQKIDEFAQQVQLPHRLTPEMLDRFDDTRDVLDAALANPGNTAGSEQLASWETLRLVAPEGSNPTPVPVS
jgi:hypothetical protein